MSTPQLFAPPTSRDVRSQAVHRLQVGLFGLCAMFLIVGLANIIMDRARLSDGREPVKEVVAVDAQPKKASSDPLADIGVVPSSEPTQSGTAASTKPAPALAP